MTTLECTFSDCEATADRILATQIMDGAGVWVAPYCDEHADVVERELRGLVACGPALADASQEIEGRR